MGTFPFKFKVTAWYIMVLLGFSSIAGRSSRPFVLKFEFGCQCIESDFIFSRITAAMYGRSPSRKC